ncbi:MAG: hypothetical protein IJY22_06955 [Clostridia bacterium]|nr:hypothetical protein [Clostridia bacterium]
MDEKERRLQRLEEAVAIATSAEQKWSSRQIKLRDQVRNARKQWRYRTECEYDALNTVARTEYMVENEWQTEGVPTLPRPFEYYGAGGKAYMMHRTHSVRKYYDQYVAALEAAGFEKYSECEAGRCISSCFTTDTLVIHVLHVSGENILRAVVDLRSAAELPPKEPFCDGTPHCAEPAIMLFGDHMFEAVDCGMGYVFRLTDGTFLLIDGGCSRPATIADALYDRLVELAEGREIVIAAWIFTHYHGDHMDAYFQFSEKYGKRVTLKRVIHNIQGEFVDTVVKGCGHSYFQKTERTREMYREPVAFYRAYTGQKYEFPDLTVEMLFGPEDYEMPRYSYDVNGTSLAFRVTSMGQTYLFLGDATEMESDKIAYRYGALLKSDAVQVAHHGYPGGTRALYDLVAAPVFFWSCPYYDPREYIADRNRYNDPNWSPLVREMAAKHAKVVYLLWEGTAILSMPIDTEHKQTGCTSKEES